MKILLGRGERDLEAEVVPQGAGYLVRLNGRSIAVEGTVGAPGSAAGSAMRVLLDGRPVEGVVRREGAELIVTARGRSYSFRTRDARAPLLKRRSGGPDEGRGDLHAPMPGLVVEVLAKIGDLVEAGRPLIVVEAMKMQNAFPAPLTGRVTRVDVKPGMPVESGQLLLSVTPEGA